MIPRTAAAEADATSPRNAIGWIGDALQKNAAANPFTRRTSASVLSMAATPLRMMEFPPGTPDELREMAENEFSEAVETAGRRQSIGCWPAPGNGREGFVPVYALAADEELAVNVAESLWEAGLRTQVLDGLPFALARGVELADPDDAHVPVAALDWGYNTATFVIALDGRPAFVRSLRDCGLRGVATALMKGFSLTADEAEELLREAGVPPARDAGSGSASISATVAEIAAEPFNRLVEELVRTLDFLSAQTSDLSPRKMWLYGCGGCVKHAAAWLTEATGVTTESWRLSGTDAARSRSMPLLGVAAGLSVLGCAP
jgi:Tfp pilus assembly PilM family ATPase